MGNIVTKKDFTWSYTDEPHATRRKQILKAHPEVKTLFGPDPMTKWTISAVVISQVVMAYFMASAPVWLMLIVAYVYGGTFNHMMSLAIHELSHNLAFKKAIHNRLFAMVANLPMGLPAAITFKKYHLDHHKYQGEDSVDVDVPTEWEGAWFNNTARKVLWVILQPAFYSLRPMFVMPKPPNYLELLNWAVQLSFDYAIYRFFGLQSLVYLIAGTLLGMGLHPVAGHFIAEHYEFITGQETYSYYGPLNIFAFNVGYHNEHHDFPYIPGSRLPALRAMAPEFYDTLPSYDSWWGVIVKYIMDPKVGPFSRIKRKRISDEQRRKLIR